MRDYATIPEQEHGSVVHYVMNGFTVFVSELPIKRQLVMTSNFFAVFVSVKSLLIIKNVGVSDFTLSN
jgi:hypothetical protein